MPLHNPEKEPSLTPSDPDHQKDIYEVLQEYEQFLREYSWNEPLNITVETSGQVSGMSNQIDLRVPGQLVFFMKKTGKVKLLGLHRGKSVEACETRVDRERDTEVIFTHFKKRLSVEYKQIKVDDPSNPWCAQDAREVEDDESGPYRIEIKWHDYSLDQLRQELQHAITTLLTQRDIPRHTRFAVLTSDIPTLISKTVREIFRKILNVK